MREVVLVDQEAAGVSPPQEVLHLVVVEVHLVHPVDHTLLQVEKAPASAVRALVRALLRLYVERLLFHRPAIPAGQ